MLRVAAALAGVLTHPGIAGSPQTLRHRVSDGVLAPGETVERNWVNNQRREGAGMSCEGQRLQNGLHGGLRSGISCGVTRRTQVLTFLLLANWFACIAHCQSELCQIGWRPAHQVQSAFQGPSQAGAGQDCPICDWVASGGYKASESRVATPDLAKVLTSAFRPAAPREGSLPPKQACFAEWSTPPPARAGTFLFVCRTALPARAPSLSS